MGRVIVVGSLNRDHTLRVARIPAGGETVMASGSAFSPGGKGANQAVAAARQGATTKLVGAVGDDESGRWLVDSATSAGVDVSGIGQVQAPTGSATILVGDDAENVIVVNAGANWHVDPSAVGREIRDCDVVVACGESTDAVIVAAAEAAKRGRARFVFNPSPSRPYPPELWPLAAVVVVNEPEFGLLRDELAPGGDVVGLRAALRVGALVVTLGHEGAIVCDEEGARRIPGIPAKAVDTSGCGDAFLGTLAARVAHGEGLTGAVARAVAAGAYAAERPGTQASYASVEELDEWLARGAQTAVAW